MSGFVHALLAMGGEFRRHHGMATALKRTAGSLRAVAFPELMRELHAQDYLGRVARKRGVDGQPWDPFHFVSHQDYLVQGLSLERRFELALAHYRQEAALFDEALLRRIYAPDGFPLWQAEVDGHRFAMRLQLAGQESLEGDLCVRLLADGQQVGSQSFVWSDSALFGGGASAPTLFIARNQTHTWPELQAFRSCFRQNSPPYFCLAALAGIGLACGMKELHAVQYRAQMCFLPKYETSFRHSYDEFWEKFGAHRVTPQAWRLALPLELRDLSELKSKHRSRAEARRRAWNEVAQVAGQAIAGHLRLDLRGDLHRHLHGPAGRPAAAAPTMRTRSPAR